ncbi:hypothetical protein [Segatella copri]|uniref:hypothetical protein n=1 Tax=Segatella copri TaxID=165179 RepID=UPI001290CF46|nr:hypothetical protein [Segatella copri]
MRTIINNQKKERDILLSRPYLTRHTQYDVDELLASKQIKLITGPRGGFEQPGHVSGF